MSRNKGHVTLHDVFDLKDRGVVLLVLLKERAELEIGSILIHKDLRVDVKGIEVKGIEDVRSNKDSLVGVLVDSDITYFKTLCGQQFEIEMKND